MGTPKAAPPRGGAIPTRAATLAPTHPGAVLRDICLPAMPQGKAEIARLLGVSRGALYNLLDEKAAVTPTMAMRLGKLFGNSAEFWLAVQAAHDLNAARADATLSAEIAAIPTLKPAEAST